MHLSDLHNKKIVVLGLGINNLHLVGYLLKQGFSFTIRDKNKQVQERFVEEHPLWTEQVQWEIMNDITQKLQGYDVIFRSPGISLNSLRGAEQKGAQISSQTSLFFDLCPAEITAITGTNGKGTTTSLIYTMLKESYKKGSVYLGGNIGVDPFSFLEELKPEDLVVLELSSFQLQDLRKGPHVAVMLHVTLDHLDHHATFEEYREAKAQLLLHQKENDIAIINGHYPDMKYYLGKVKGKRYVYTRHTPARQSAWAQLLDHKEVVFYQMESGIESFEVTGRRLLGQHNLENILPAVLVAAYYGVPAKVMQETVKEFPGLEHRLSYIGTAGGIDFYDDSIATTPESSTVAIEAFPDRRLHLIVGGRDKGSDYLDWAALAVQHCATISILPGAVSKKLERILQAAIKHGPSSETKLLTKAAEPLMDTILSGIHPHLRRGDVVLLSPAAASDEPFGNYKVRGDSFSAAIHKRYAKDHGAR